MKKAFFQFFVLLIISTLPILASAQASGGQDSTGTGLPDLRARRDAYIIVPFPSPAKHGQIMKMQFYTHTNQECSFRIVDLNDKTVLELQTQQMTPNGIHSFDFPTGLYSSGTYFVRLTTYSSTGSQNVVQDMRFLVVH